MKSKTKHKFLEYKKTCKELYEELEETNNPVTKSSIKDILSRRAVQLEEVVMKNIENESQQTTRKEFE